MVDKIAALHSELTRYTILLATLHEAEKALQAAQVELNDWSMDNGHLLGLLAAYDQELGSESGIIWPAKPDKPAPKKTRQNVSYKKSERPRRPRHGTTEGQVEYFYRGNAYVSFGAHADVGTCEVFYVDGRRRRGIWLTPAEASQASPWCLARRKKSTP